ncbi:putative serine/threonine kinase [Hordeum vulgare]|nr:putative serine/threonine kinase [Hordeum vulgare]
MAMKRSNHLFSQEQSSYRALVASTLSHMIQRGLSLFQNFGMRNRKLFSDVHFSFLESKRKQAKSISRPKESYVCYFDRAENTADSDATKGRDLDGLPDTQEPKAMPRSIGTFKHHKGVEGTVLRHDNTASPGVASTMTKLSSSPSRKAFSVQDKVYALWSSFFYINLKYIG